MSRGWIPAFVLASAFALSSVPAAAQEPACRPMTDRMALEGRLSPYDSTTIRVDGRSAKICYGRPSARGRTMIGGDAVPYGQLWRTGANEPTTLHLPFAAELAGIRLEPGAYSIYTIPGLERWVVIVNAATDQWGHESAYTDQVQAQELGRAVVEAHRLPEHRETFTIRSGGSEGQPAILMEWERTGVRIPIRAL